MARRRAAHREAVEAPHVARHHAAHREAERAGYPEGHAHRAGLADFQGRAGDVWVSSCASYVPPGHHPARAHRGHRRRAVRLIDQSDPPGIVPGWDGVLSLAALRRVERAAFGRGHRRANLGEEEREAHLEGR